MRESVNRLYFNNAHHGKIKREYKKGKVKLTSKAEGYRRDKRRQSDRKINYPHNKPRAGKLCFAADFQPLQKRPIQKARALHSF